MGILLVDDHVLFVEALRSLLERYHIEVVGTAGDGLEAVERVRAVHPDIVLMDINMPRCDGIEATRLIKAEFQDVKVVMLTMSDDDDDLFNAIASGASGYITKDSTPEVFLELLAGLARGEVAVTRTTATRIMNRYVRGGQTPVASLSLPASLGGKGDETPSELSPRQVEVLRLTAEGHTYKQIAALLSISVRTVNYHIDEIIGKLRLQNRTQAIAYAVRHGLMRDRGVDNRGPAKAWPHAHPGSYTQTQ
jgi:two-component system NarL family response regulator